MRAELPWDLVHLYGPSGHEGRVAELRPWVDQVHTDPMGNVIARREGRGPGSVAVIAHMDDGEPGGASGVRPRRMASKSIDDRVGCAMLVEIARSLKDRPTSTLYLIGTVQEEIGSWGARYAAPALGGQPDCVIALDTTGAQDATTDPYRTAPIGGGPVLRPASGGLIPRRYSHSPLEVVDLADAEGAVRIMVRVLQELEAKKA